MKQDLVLITNFYPLGYGEAFIENEITFLHQKFNKIIIISRSSYETNQTRSLPENTELLRLPPKSTFIKKIILLPTFLNNIRLLLCIIKEEKAIIKTRYGLVPSLQHIKIMCHDALKALEIKYFINRNIKKLVSNEAILYSYWQNSSALALALLKKQNKNYTCICRAHGSDLYFSRHQSNYLPFRHYISKNLDLICFISENGYKYQKKLLKQNYNSFIISKLGSLKIENRKNQKLKNIKVIVSCSSLVTVKRIDLLVKSLAEIDSEKIEWIHFGGGPLSTEIVQLATKLLGAKSNISFAFKGQVSNSVIHEYYAENKIDLFINVSSSEGIPVSIMEALSYGIPVLATDVGGNSEIVDKMCGRLIPKDCPPAKIALIIQQELMKNKTEAAFQKWNLEFNAIKNYPFFVNQVELKLNENRRRIN